MRIGDILRTSRLEKGLNQVELSQKSGVSCSQICRLESGKLRAPTFRTICKLAGALRIPLSRLARAED